MNQTKITEDILEKNGFELIGTNQVIKSHYKDQFGIDNYVEYRIWTKDKNNAIKIDIDNGINNRGTKWHVHIDNELCESIGCADIDTIYEFNTLMKVFGSEYELKEL